MTASALYCFISGRLKWLNVQVWGIEKPWPNWLDRGYVRH